MSNHPPHDPSVRQPQPDAAARDPRNEAMQEVHESAEASREEMARLRATTPNEVSEKTVAEIVAEAEARAKR